MPNIKELECEDFVDVARRQGESEEEAAHRKQNKTDLEQFLARLKVCVYGLCVCVCVCECVCV